jgi:histidinol-phosphate aminotransferase
VTPIEFAARVGRLPDYPVAGGYSLPGDVAMLASNESPWPPAPEVVEAAARADASAHR